MIGLDTTSTDGACIKVIGVGGGGGNAINNMVKKGLTGVEFIACNTDKQALDHNLASIKIQLGKEATRGLGAGANPEIGKSSMEASEDAIKDALDGADMVFVTCGMGGGTGTGGTPTVAKIAKEMGMLVVSIVTKPFKFEGRKRNIIAEQWLKELKSHVDALIVIPNQRLLEVIDQNTSFAEAYLKVDEVLYDATRGISDIISCHGVINVDFADVKAIMSNMGDALMGIGLASGEHRATEATQNALNSPLLDGISIHGAKGLLVNITGGKNMTMHEISDAVTLVEQAAGGDAELIHGVVYNDDLHEEIMVTLVATGFNSNSSDEESVEIINNELKFEEKLELPNFKENDNPFGEVKFSEKTKSYTASPKGPNQLKKFDKPAVYRNLGSVKLGEQNNARLNQLTNKKPIMNPNSKEVQNTPAIKRKF